jgi:hypothetical protein
MAYKFVDVSSEACRLSWKSFSREMARAQRNAEKRQRAYERAVAQSDRQRERARKEQQKVLELAHAADQSAQFQDYLDALVAVHRSPPAHWDWGSIVAEQAPVVPARSAVHENAARGRLGDYRPGFFDALFGRDKKRRAELEVELLLGVQRDEEEHQKAVAAWQGAYREWEVNRALGERVLRSEYEAYPQALEAAGAYECVAVFETVVFAREASSSAIALDVEIRSDEIVPTEIVKLSAAGKLGTKAMPLGQYWDLYQDHVCSCALRLGCEAFAVLPVERVVVNIGANGLSSATGHPERVTFLAVQFTREQLQALRLENVDASDSMRNFSHRMKFMKTKGFQAVEPITLAEQFITT